MEAAGGVRRAVLRRDREEVNTEGGPGAKAMRTRVTKVDTVRDRRGAVWASSWKVVGAGQW